jgi:hypothetical protein
MTREKSDRRYVGYEAPQIHQVVTVVLFCKRFFDRYGCYCMWMILSQMNTSHLLYFIKHPFFQCIGQEPNPKQFHRLWQRTSRQTNASLSQPLVTWAQYTEAFDSILIFIDVSVLYDACFQLSRATISRTRPRH